MSGRGRIATMLVALAACPCAALGSVIVSLNNPGSTTLHEVWVQPGETFEIDLNLDADCALFWVRTALRADVSDVFDVLQVVIKGPWISTTHTTLLGGVDPVTESFSASLPHPVLLGPGTIEVATIHFSVELTAPLGSYGIGVSDPLYATSPMNPVGPFPAFLGPTLVVNVVPEPATSLIISVLLMAVATVWRPR